MNINVGNTDRVARIAVGALLIILALTGIIGVWGWIGILPLATGIFRVCPGYSLIGVNTCTKD